ncbi:MAG TPA: FAD-binding protein [Kineosporiaceae bacterium]|nr:FAD-binding protein [Kineosporiaceae bacterium]
MTAVTTHLPEEFVLPTQRTPLDQLRSRLVGAVHEPADHEYDALVTPWNLAVPTRPAAVVQARTAADVVQAVRFAGAHGLTAGVQATGHGAVSTLAGHLLVSTKGLDEITVHPRERWARVGAGMKWSHLVPHVAPHGLAGVSGSITDVGIVGYTTGGGVGPMARTHGINADKVRAIEVVTGDGEFHRVTPESDPDLFFALRGGKGAAGIVTAMEIDLVELPTFYGGSAFFAADDMPAVIAAWQEWSAELPFAGTTSIGIFQMPEMPGVPEPIAGRMTLSVRFLWTGSPEDGERWFARLRRVATPVLDSVGVHTYPEIDLVHTDPLDPVPAHEVSTLLSGFDTDAAEVLLGAAGPGSGSPQVLVELRQLGGAYAYEGDHPSAFAHRSAAYSLLAVGIAGMPGVEEHASSLVAALRPWDTGRVWPNFAPPHDAASARRAYDPATLARLTEITAAYDPHGVLAAGAYTRA